MEASWKMVKGSSMETSSEKRFTKIRKFTPCMQPKLFAVASYFILAQEFWMNHILEETHDKDCTRGPRRKTCTSAFLRKSWIKPRVSVYRTLLIIVQAISERTRSFFRLCDHWIYLCMHACRGWIYPQPTTRFCYYVFPATENRPFVYDSP